MVEYPVLTATKTTRVRSTNRFAVLIVFSTKIPAYLGNMKDIDTCLRSLVYYRSGRIAGNTDISAFDFRYPFCLAAAEANTEPFISDSILLCASHIA